MNKNILRYSLFGFYRRSRGCLIYFLPSYNDCIININSRSYLALSLAVAKNIAVS